MRLQLLQRLLLGGLRGAPHIPLFLLVREELPQQRLPRLLVRGRDETLREKHSLASSIQFKTSHNCH